MFNLDAYILRWRRGMASWGLPADKLDELEEHLRDAFEVKVERGIDEPRALMAAQNELGDPKVLRREYRKETFARLLDRSWKFTLSFSAMRAATLLSLLVMLLLVFLGQTIDRWGQLFPRTSVVFYVFFLSSIWGTTLMCGLVVIAAIQRLLDSHQRFVLAFITVASIAASILVFNRPTTIGWGGAGWIYLLLLISYFLRGKEFAVVASVACGLIILISFLARPSDAIATLNMRLLYRTLIDIIPAIILTYVLATAPSDIDARTVTVKNA